MRKGVGKTKLTFTSATGATTRLFDRIISLSLSLCFLPFGYSNLMYQSKQTQDLSSKGLKISKRQGKQTKLTGFFSLLSLSSSSQEEVFRRSQ